MVKKKNIVKKTQSKRNIKKKVNKQPTREGYTEEMKREVVKIKKLTKSKVDFEKKYAMNKKNLFKELTELEEKRNAEAENLKKLVKFVGDQ